MQPHVSPTPSNHDQVSKREQVESDLSKASFNERADRHEGGEESPVDGLEETTDEDMREYIRDFVIPDYKRRIAHLQNELRNTEKHYGLGSANHDSDLEDDVQLNLFLKGKVRQLEEELPERIIGQEEAVSLIIRACKRACAGVRDTEKPIVSMMFTGRTGVGKTHTAKMLAQVLVEQDAEIEYEFMKIDCSEFSGGHENGKLIGAPPGYIGYDDGGRFDQVVENPYQVILFDEIEKGSPTLHNMLLQILDDGRATLADGTEIDFSNCIILMSSNVGVSQLDKATGGVSFAPMKQTLTGSEISSVINAALAAEFKPEFLNRIDEIIGFNDLTVEHCKDIAIREMNTTLERAERFNPGVKISYTAEVVSKIVEDGYSPKFGAREIRRAVNRLFADALADCLFDYDLEEMKGLELKAYVLGAELKIASVERK